jgi:hypothetical protein
MPRLILPRAILSGVVPALLCCLVVGCGGKGHRVSGKVTFNGQPVPAGKIFFIPDASKGNSGPTGYADIRDGSYDTSAKGGRGTDNGGAVIVAIEGYDPNAPATKDEQSGEEIRPLLFPRYETHTELPTSSTTKDFDVPASAATPGGQPGGPIIP